MYPKPPGDLLFGILEPLRAHCLGTWGARVWYLIPILDDGAYVVCAESKSH